MLIERLPYAYPGHPLAHVERGALLGGVEVVVSYDAYLREPTVELEDVSLERLALCWRAGIFRAHVAVASTHIHDVSAHAVVPCRTIGDLPVVHLRVLIVLYQSLHTPVEVEQVGIAHLLPATPCRWGRGVPSAYFIRTHLAPLRRGGAMDDEIFHRLAHHAFSLYPLAITTPASVFLGMQMK